MNTFDNIFLKSQKQAEFTNIINNWGTSSVMLKKYLAKFEDQFSFGYAEKLDGININYILRYTNKKSSMLFGEVGINRLKLAMLAKAYIMNELGDLEDYQKYIAECLHLYLRINSLATNYAFGAFKNDLFSAYNKIYNADEDTLLEVKRMLLDKMENYKPKRVQTKYHYCLEDFENVSHIYNNYKDAYDAWVKYYFPYILEDYKKAQLDAYKRELAIAKLEDKYISAEAYLSLIDKKEKELDNVKIVCLSEKSFKTTICRLYKKNNKENNFIIKKEVVKKEVVKKEEKKTVDYSAQMAADTAKFMENYKMRMSMMPKPIEQIKAEQTNNIEEKKIETKNLSYAELLEQSRQSFNQMYNNNCSLMDRWKMRMAL